jgi:hypothetical protein
MVRHLMLFPRSADPDGVEELVARMAPIFRRADGFRSLTVSVDALMGPAARTGTVGRVVQADFDTLDDALAVLDADGFGELRERTEQLGPDIFLYEVADL